jgi:hypothetical protein
LDLFILVSPTTASPRSYKLGTLATPGYKTYTNQYAVNDCAKSLLDRYKERATANGLARKFSLTEDGLFYVRVLFFAIL